MHPRSMHALQCWHVQFDMPRSTESALACLATGLRETSASRCDWNVTLNTS